MPKIVFIGAGSGFGQRLCADILAHEELRDTPIVDKASCVLMANNEILLDLIEKGELERARHVTAWNIWAAKAYGVKAVNPGGVVAWKWGKDAKILSAPVEGYSKVTPAKIIAGLATSTFAPEILAPDESSTSPAIVPEFVPPCPHAEAATSRHTTTYPKNMLFLMITPPPQ